MRRPISLAVSLLGVISLLSAAREAHAQGDDCAALIANGTQMMLRGELSMELAPLDIDDPQFACVWRTTDADKDFCKNTKLPLEPPKQPPNPEWNGMDFRWELLQLVLNPSNYNSCASIFEGDGILAAALSRVPPLSDSQRQNYLHLAHFRRSYGNLDDEPPVPSDFTDTQSRILTVFDRLGKWAYCATDKIGPLADGSHGRTLGKFDPSTMKITFYNGLCTSKKLYGLDISFVTSTHRAFLIAGHELGHAIDAASGGEKRNPLSSEAIATYYGSLFAECGARRLNELKRTSLEFLETAPETSDMDRRYAVCLTRYWSEMEAFFREARAKIDLVTGQMPGNLRMLNAEMETYPQPASQRRCH